MPSSPRARLAPLAILIGIVTVLACSAGGEREASGASTARNAAPPASPLEAAQALAGEDRRFSDLGATDDLVTSITRMLAVDAVMPTGPAGFAEGREEIAAALRADSLNATSRANWIPIRAGISADGMQGFTLGFLDVTRADGTVLPGKYLSYWERRVDGWRVVAYKRVRRAIGRVETTPWLPVLPEALMAPTTDSSAIAAHRASLAQAERDFSRDAQVIGIGPAFLQYGAESAMHLGGPTEVDFIVGSDNIAKSVGAGLPPKTSPVTWAPDHRVIVASSGDLGVTVGYIMVKPDRPGAVKRAPIPFFTVWHRASPNAPWRYVAE